MDRRRALAIAAVTATTSVAAAAAIAANFGLLVVGAADATPAGNLDAGRVIESVDASSGPAAAPNPASEVTIRYEDIYLPAPSAAPTTPAMPPAPPPTIDGAGTDTAATLEAGDGAEHEAGDEDDHDDGHDDGHEEDD